MFAKFSIPLRYGKTQVTFMVKEKTRKKLNGATIHFIQQAILILSIQCWKLNYTKLKRQMTDASN